MVENEHEIVCYKGLMCGRRGGGGGLAVEWTTIGTVANEKNRI